MTKTATLHDLQSQQLARRESFSSPVRAGFFDAQSFELMQRISKGFATSTLVPKEYQGNIANCMIALNMAQRLNADPIMVMQNLYLVHGRPSWSAQFLIATANTCGRFTAIRFEFFGEKGTDSWGCRAWAIERDTDEKLVGADVTIGLAKKEGWYSKNGSKWQSMPQQMLRYRAGAWWVRAYAPELSMGLSTADEVIDTFAAERGPDGVFTVTADDLHNAIPSVEPEQPETNTTETTETTETGELPEIPDDCRDLYIALSECDSRDALEQMWKKRQRRCRKGVETAL